MPFAQPLPHRESQFWFSREVRRRLEFKGCIHRIMNNIKLSYHSGHIIDGVPELPLVLDDKVEEIKKTKEAVGVLRKLKVWPDIEKVALIGFK